MTYDEPCKPGLLARFGAGARRNHHPGEDAGLYDAVKAVGEELCPELGICIPVGKDSMSMKSVWRDDSGERSVTAPLSLIISAFTGELSYLMLVMSVVRPIRRVTQAVEQIRDEPGSWKRRLSPTDRNAGGSVFDRRSRPRTFSRAESSNQCWR